MNQFIQQEQGEANHSLIIKQFNFSKLTEDYLINHSSASLFYDDQTYRDISAVWLIINEGEFTNKYQTLAFPEVKIVYQFGDLHLHCSCSAEPGKLCGHQSQVLMAVLKREEFRLFFDEPLRQERFKKFASDYGLENETELHRFFKIDFLDNKAVINPVQAGLTAVTPESIRFLKELVIVKNQDHLIPHEAAEQSVCVVFKQHKYYKYLQIDLFKANLTKEGKVKNPLQAVSPLDFVWHTDDHQELKFFTGIHKFQNNHTLSKSETDLVALKVIANNPLDYNFYYHRADVSENINAASVTKVQVDILPDNLVLKITQQDRFYKIALVLKINEEIYELADLHLKFSYFLQVADHFYLVDSLQALVLIEFLKKKTDNLLVHQTKFKEFKKELLSKLEDKVAIDYQYIKPASAVQLVKHGFADEPEKIIYLSDFGSQVMIIPIMRYGEAEVPVRSRRQIYGEDTKGNEFLVKRNDDEEINFTALILKEHPHFEEQIYNDLHYFYLHKNRFLEEEWFLNTFEEWQSRNISVLGFNEIENNKLNPNRLKITIHVISGINWFNTIVNARFGKKKASLKQLHKAIRNKSKFVKLDDGTLGILPAEWIEKFTEYFNAGEIFDDETLRIPKINFATIEQNYADLLVDEETRNEISIYSKKLADFTTVPDIDVPADLQTILRPYQKAGLNWLNFLDDFNFGGCLADDMGLGKTIQIIAFILSQRHKAKQNTNLLVVPTSLIFNWQAELAKFAPSIKVQTIYGAHRLKNTEGWHTFEVVLTSYGTLLSDINFIKNFNFNYVFLDESQAIKNPESQRYKAVRLLQSRNKVVITGTPIENNTFDLYGQLSFACPGLLGSKQYFKDIYSSPIDKFQDSRRAVELQNKVKQFVLRRTKQEVAADLPEKTEMVLYCEMKAEQQKIYNAYEKEFRDYISATDNDELKKSPMNVLKGLTRLRQICDSPLLLAGEKLPGDESIKIEVLLEQIELKAPQHKILVFSQFVSMLDLIKKELVKKNIPFCYLTGQTRNRAEVINEFQNNKEVRVFLISLKAGGAGLNLTEADYVYLVDPWWNPAVENQAIDRCHRIGQDKKIVAVRLICSGTVEEKIQKMQESKKELMDTLINTGASVLKGLGKEGLMSLLK